MIYIVVFFLLFLFSFTKRKVNNRLFFVGVFALLIIASFRSHSIGIDTSGGYLSYYHYIESGGNLSWVEPAWVVVNKICIWLRWGYTGVIAVSGLLTIVPVSYVIAKTCDNKCFGLAVYYGMYLVLYSFNMMRQCIAISFVLLAFYYYIYGKRIKAGIWFLLGFVFHASVVVAIAAVLFLKIRLSYNKIIVLVLFSLFSGIVLTNQVFFFISGQYASNLLLNDGYSGFRNSILIPALLCAAVSVFFVLTAMVGFEKIKNNPWFSLALLGVLVMNLTMRLGQGTRVVLYFSQVQMIYIPNYVKSIDTRKRKSILAVAFTCYLGLNFIRILYSQWESLVPYSFFWNN